MKPVHGYWKVRVWSKVGDYGRDDGIGFDDYLVPTWDRVVDLVQAELAFDGAATFAIVSPIVE